MAKKKTIMERAQALLAMSESAANEHEAAIAMKRLHAMLAKHNISIAELEDGGKDEPVGEMAELIDNRPWAKSIALAVARLYFCELYVMPRGKKTIAMIVGKEHNRIFAKAIIGNIMRTIDTRSRAESRETYGRIEHGFVNSFRNSAMQTICKRCDDLIAAAKAGELEMEDGSTLPVLASVYDTEKALADAFMADMGLRTRKSSHRVTDPFGAAAGKRTGNSVQLSRALQGKSSPKLIGDK